jgi:hypothetical protein
MVRWNCMVFSLAAGWPVGRALSKGGIEKRSPTNQSRFDLLAFEERIVVHRA